jgi:hypothetical protein
MPAFGFAHALLAASQLPVVTVLIAAMWQVASAHADTNSRVEGVVDPRELLSKPVGKLQGGGLAVARCPFVAARQRESSPGFS